MPLEGLMPVAEEITIPKDKKVGKKGPFEVEEI